VQEKAFDPVAGKEFDQVGKKFVSNGKFVPEEMYNTGGKDRKSPNDDRTRNNLENTRRIYYASCVF